MGRLRSFTGLNKIYMVNLSMPLHFPRPARRGGPCELIGGTVQGVGLRIALFYTKGLGIKILFQLLEARRRAITKRFIGAELLPR
jgi:hypothetical protein